MNGIKLGNALLDTMIHSQSLKRSELYINSFEDEDVQIISYYINRLVELQNKYPKLRKKEIVLLIDSDGGSAVNMFYLRDRLKQLEKNGWIIKGVSQSRAYSAGAFILLGACTKGYRYAYENTDIMLHDQNWYNFSRMRVQDARDEAKMAEKLLNKLKKLVFESTNLTDEHFEKYISSRTDMFLSASEALELGIIDHII